MSLPPDMILEVTAKCNFSCPYCYCVWHENPAPPPRNATAAKWKKIIDLCAENGVKNLTFSGGEALMRKDISELIVYARQIMPQTVLGLFTNNSRMTEEFFFLCKENRVQLATSLQGLRTYSEMSGTRRTFHRTLQWLSFAAENQWQFSVSMTATKVNKYEFADMFCAAAISGAAHITMGAMMAAGRGKQHLSLALRPDEWEELKTDIRNLPNANTPYSFSDEMICTCREQPAELLKKFAPKQIFPCEAGKKFGVISPSGKFRQCLHTPYESALFI